MKKILLMGNPNVGSIVLNKTSQTKEFKQFCTNFASGDRIFIVSSIFGGTGAAGFPLLVKLLRSGSDKVLGAHAAELQKAPIGSVTVLPYFNLEPGSGFNSIDSSLFIAKTKAALTYYTQNLTGVNAAYYIGDSQKSTYRNHPGRNEQRNQAHLVELLAAVAAFEFMKLDQPSLNLQSQCNEYALRDADPVSFKTIGENTRQAIAHSMTQFILLSTLLRDHLEDSLHQPWARRIKLTLQKLRSDLYRDHLSSFCNSLFIRDWLSELDSNQRVFRPFHLGTQAAAMGNLVAGYPCTTTLWRRDRLDGVDFDKQFNLVIQKGLQAQSTEAQFLEIMWRGTQAILGKRYQDFK